VPNLIEVYMPDYDVRARYETRVRASAEVTYEALRRVDLFASWPVRALFAIRRLPARGRDARFLTKRTFESFTSSGALLAEERGREAAFGIIGRFWAWRRPSYTPPVSRDIASFAEPGWAKSVLTMTVDPLDGTTTLLSTETRVKCTDAGSLRRFRLYWALIGPFSGLIRKIWLAAIRDAAETAWRERSRIDAAAIGSPHVAAKSEGERAGD
jgi:hypothetical protein